MVIFHSYVSLPQGIYIVGETSILVGKYQKKHQLMEVFLYNGYVHIYIYISGWFGT